jgi:hypothetical protein
VLGIATLLTLSALEAPGAAATGAPVVQTAAASGIVSFAATLHGSVNPNGAVVSDCHFEYGTTFAYGMSVGCDKAPGSGTSPVAVSTLVPGLAQTTTYHFSLVATNVKGTVTGGDATFTTGSTWTWTQPVWSGPGNLGPEPGINGVPYTYHDVPPPPPPPSQAAAQPPSNEFSVRTPTVGKGKSITLLVNSPGEGVFTATALTMVGRVRAAIATRHRNTTKHKGLSVRYGTGTVAAKRAGPVLLVVPPSTTAKEALKRIKHLSVSISVTFTPTGGTSNTKTVSVTVTGHKRRH